LSSNHEILLAGQHGWVFKSGNDTSWANPKINTGSWEKLKPTQLNKKMADKDGRLEGWFRIKIKLDSSFIDSLSGIGLMHGSWATADIYVNGKLFHSFGSTGYGNLAFKEYNDNNKMPPFINLVPEKEYLLAVHFVDFVDPIFRKLRSAGNLPSFISLTGSKFISVREEINIKEKIYLTIWTAVCAVLSLLFWLLYTQNPIEKNLRLIALCVTFLTLNLFCNNASGNIPGLSYVNQQLIYLGASLFGILTFSMIPFILAYVFKGKVTIYLKIFLILNFIVLLLSVILLAQSVIPTVPVFMLFAVCIYYVVSSWKNLRGAQWAIVAGLTLTLFWLLMFAINGAETLQNHFTLLYVTGTYLSFPLGLLVYVSVRFKEIINEVRDNAQQVLQLSEEKKEHALHQQKILQEEVNRQTAEIRTTLDNLKSTQSQLIQSEKMASLGELTAGIAHEIQNPLNFVNNFSEVNKEMLEELKAERLKPNAERNNTLEDELINDVIDNSDKINHHGKRAGDIVKGMMEHSRSSTGVKEPTDINALADEYLRLTYQGLRAKDKDFNAEMVTDFDQSIGKINIIPQDIGRVLLNLYNNAFYACTERSRSTVNEEKSQNRISYHPTVSVTTKKEDNHVTITVSDNGNGIPKNIVDKIFQPFFTTKPTGQGTGLGLSLSYDIVKAHGGEIKVNTVENEGTEFIIQLPTNKV